MLVEDHGDGDSLLDQGSRLTEDDDDSIGDVILEFDGNGQTPELSCGGSSGTVLPHRTKKRSSLSSVVHWSKNLLRNGSEATQHVVRRWLFKTLDTVREVSLQHLKSLWTLSLDSVVIVTQSHSSDNPFSANRYTMSFEVHVGPADSGETREEKEVVRLPAELKLHWVVKKLKWRYALAVNGISIAASARGRSPSGGALPPIVTVYMDDDFQNKATAPTPHDGSLSLEHIVAAAQAADLLSRRG